MDNVKDRLLTSFRNKLNMRVIYTPRFSVKFPKDIVFEMLLIAYTKEVNISHREFRETSELINTMKKIAQWLCDNTNKDGLLLYGLRGTGKTTTMKAILDVINIATVKDDDYRETCLCSALSLADTKLNNLDRFNYYKDVQFLGIDDVGIEPVVVNDFGTKWTPFIEILYSRYDKRLPTIISSNLIDADLCDRYGERVYDRICEMFDTIYYNNDSYRKPIKNN